MFTFPSTPSMKLRSKWSSTRYNNAHQTPNTPTPTSLSITTTNPHSNQKSTTITSTLIQPIDFPIDPQLTQSSSPAPLLPRERQLDSSSSPFLHHQRIISTSPPPSLERNLHTSPMQLPYPNTPSPHSYGLSGTVIVNEPSSIMQPPHASSDCGSQSDVFISQALPKNQRNVLRPSLSHNALLNTSPSSWPRRVMTTGSTFTHSTSSSAPTAVQVDDRLNGHRPQSTPIIAPPVNFSAASAISENNNNNNKNNNNNAIVHGHHHQNAVNHHQHEANTPYLSMSTSASSNTSNISTAPFATHSTYPPQHPHPHPQHQHQHQQSNYYPHEETHYPTYDGYPSSTSSPWQTMTTILPPHHPHHPPQQQQQNHPQQQQQQQQSPYHWGMHHMAIPSKQDEPILAAGELPAPRPPMSYAALIGEALLMAPPPHQLYVSEISDSIKKRYPYYRQNPTKIYNGVRHQTSMCKAFVKLPRPFGDQSGGARKWAIRAGCEGWFAGGGYHPPSSNMVATKPSKAGGKAKATARSKHLIIGTPEDKKISRDIFAGGYPSSGSSGEGPSSGPAYDGTIRPSMPYSYSQYNPSNGFAAPAPPPSHSHLGPGYHYVPIPSAHGHPQSAQPIYVPVWGPYASQQPQGGYQYPHMQGPGQGPQGYSQGSQSPEHWSRGMNGVDNQSNDGTHISSNYEEVKMISQPAGSPAPSAHSIGRSIHSSHGASPETM
ncbi:uncharacterized protein IL334_006242 [Kwoniella shivajii]|uniref:Fork-head domain-containing protein n=1 Tax=Kwoniella shivajii TaxID=564305 RepID=A0ABZ1D5Q8_9TREE|nr:hypothetical protein IL334_006242 [Kwoniella shivajii]